MALLPFGSDFQTRDMQDAAPETPLAGVKYYMAYVSQTDTDPPVASIEFINTLGGEITFDYSDVGIYAVQSDNLFTTRKTFILITTDGPVGAGGSFVMTANHDGEDTIVVQNVTNDNDGGASLIRSDLNGYGFYIYIAVFP